MLRWFFFYLIICLADLCCLLCMHYLSWQIKMQWKRRAQCGRRQEKNKVGFFLWNLIFLFQIYTGVNWALKFWHKIIIFMGKHIIYCTGLFIEHCGLDSDYVITIIHYSYIAFIFYLNKPDWARIFGRLLTCCDYYDHRYCDYETWEKKNKTKIKQRAALICGAFTNRHLPCLAPNCDISTIYKIVLQWFTENIESFYDINSVNK